MSRTPEIRQMSISVRSSIDPAALGGSPAHGTPGTPAPGAGAAPAPAARRRRA
ncbi:hypothetical protein ACWGE1_05790 [Streptomyces sp. NPDC054932]